VFDFYGTVIKFSCANILRINLTNKQTVISDLAGLRLVTLQQQANKLQYKQ